MTITHADLWDCINEGGEGFRPEYARRAAPVKAAPVAGAKKYTKSFRPAAKVQASLDILVARLAVVTDLYARELIERDIAAMRADLA